MRIRDWLSVGFLYVALFLFLGNEATKGRRPWTGIATLNNRHLPNDLSVSQRAALVMGCGLLHSVLEPKLLK